MRKYLPNHTSPVFGISFRKTPKYIKTIYAFETGMHSKAHIHS